MSNPSSDQVRNMMVGICMLAACAFTIALILFLKPSIGNEAKTYYVRFANINGIGDGTRVLFAGRPVGEVSAITEITDARGEPADSLGRTYFYQLTLKVDSSVTIYKSDQVGVQTSGLLGEKSIAITPVAPPPGTLPVLVGKDPIYAQSADSLETAFYELSTLANEMYATFHYLQNWLNKNGNTLSAAVSSFQKTMNQAEKALTSVNQTQLVEQVKEGALQFSLAMERIQCSLQEMQEGHFFSNLNKTGASVEQITRDLASGKGTLGKLIEDKDIYLRVASFLDKSNTLMNDINHYGILFHLNKTWQRERLQKVTLMNSLESPNAFKEYFTKEVDGVSMAMARLSMLLEKAQGDPTKQEIFSNKQFSEDFAEFLQEVESLADSARLYNEQLIDLQYQSKKGS
jgi:phospholipid/cholesterol/gamma-HCH transport system substrate-binding protein